MINNRLVAYLSVIAFISTIWLNVDLKIGDTIIPNFLHIFIMIALLKIKKISRNNATLFLYTSITLAMVALANPLQYWMHYLKGSIQLLAAMVTSVFFFDILVHKKARLNLFSKAILVITIFISLLAILEASGILRSLLDDIRLIIYQKSIYLSYDRDISQYGIIRPMVLNREPAHLAFLLSTLWFYCLISSKKMHKTFIAFIIFTFLIIVTRSPVSILFITVYFLTKISLNKKISAKKIFILIFSILILTPAISFMAYSVFLERIQFASSGMDFSFFSRLILPALTTINVIFSEPLFGTGVTSKEVIFDYVYDLLINYNFGWRIQDFTDDEVSNSVTSYTFLLPIYTGLLGTSTLILILYKFMKKYFNPYYTIIILLVFFVFGLGIGGLVNSKTWFTLSLLMLGFYQYLHNDHRSK